MRAIVLVTLLPLAALASTDSAAFASRRIDGAVPAAQQPERQSRQFGNSDWFGRQNGNSQNFAAYDDDYYGGSDDFGFKFDEQQPQQQPQLQPQQQPQQPRRRQFQEAYNSNGDRRYNYKRPEQPPPVEYREELQRPRGYDRQRPLSSSPDSKRRLKVKKNKEAAAAFSKQAEERTAFISEPTNVAAPVQESGNKYKPASGPAYATATNIDELEMRKFDQAKFPPLEYKEDSQAPAEQRDIQAAVYRGANSYKPDGVYQKEDRLEFQIHGHQGPHSYRYGYDTGSGYNRQFRYEERDKHGYVKGRYGFFDRYGKLQVVNYSADPHKGFHAEGAHVPKYPH